MDGRIGFDGTAFRFPASTLDATGGLRIGEWMPDFDFQLRSRDLSEIDRLFQNFVGASGSVPSPLGFGGSGDIEGHIAKSWGNPEVTAKFSAENARYGGVLFGSVRGAADMHDGAFVFHPLRAYEGSATISLEGTARYRKDTTRPTLDLAVTAKDFPVSRFLQYLELDYPIEGRLTGSFPIVGNPAEGVTGSGAAALDDAVIWGQKVSRLTGRMDLTPGHFTLDDVRADLGGGMIGGRLAIAYREKTFEVRAAGDDVPLEALQAMAAAPEVSGRISFELAGKGPFDKPDLTASASLSDGVVYGHPIPAAMDPRLSVRVVHGDLQGELSVPERWKVSARGDLSATPAAFDVGVDVRDLAALLLFTPAAMPAGDGGALAAHGQVRLVIMSKSYDRY